MSQAPSIACSSAELLYLASLRGGTAHLGVDDPLQGQSPEEVEETLLLARDALIERRFLAFQRDGELVIDYDVARMVDALTRPRRTFFTFQVALEQTQRRIFHLRGSVAAELVAHGDHVELIPLAGRAGVADAILAFWSVVDQQAASGAERATISQDAMRIAGSLAARDAAPEAEQHLREAGASEAAAGALAHTLRHARRNAALVVSAAGREAGRTAALGLLEGDNGLWRLRPMVRADVPVVELEPCSGPELADHLRAFVAAVS